MSRAGWDFEYTPIPTWLRDDDGGTCDLVVATACPTQPDEIERALRPLLPDVIAESLVARPPIFWSRVRSACRGRRSDLAEHMAAAGLRVRYVASTSCPSPVVPGPLRTLRVPRARVSGWTAREPFPYVDPDTPGRWFLRARAGVAVDRARCGSGLGTRLAVIDDDAAGVEQVELDAEILVNLGAAPRNMLHGATMVALAVGARQSSAAGDNRFAGVAPHASPRLYCIPKPGSDVVSLPISIIRAVDDGADVVMCATYIEGTTSPMLDDALEFACRFGRGGRGTAVVLPVGRETSSPPRSVHASLSLSLCDPSSDPRVFCVGPSGKEGGWFFWRDRKGKLRPFANRGPACRWLAPGDDLTFPFTCEERLSHAESSGASALAAGVILLVLAANPALHLSELDQVLTRTVSPIEPSPERLAGELADPSDELPAARDRDGHNAKHGYGRLHAQRACLAAADPIAAALIAIGEDEAAASYLDMRRARTEASGAYSDRFGRWGARALIRDSRAMHAACALMRHARLVLGNPARRKSHGEGAIVRQLAILLGLLGSSRLAPKPSPAVAAELKRLASRARRVGRSSTEREQWEAQVCELWADVQRKGVGEVARAESPDGGGVSPAARRPLGSPVLPS